jgi:type I restriction enzyme, S subunit
MKKGWQIKKLGDVCAFDKVQGIHRGLPYVGLEHIESHTARFIGSADSQPVKSSTFRFSDAHVLYGRLRPYLNKALAPDFEGHCSTEIFPLKPSHELSREYLLYWLLDNTTCERINETCTGARMPRAQMNEVMGFDIPVPPLPEQRRIVGLLDEAFECLATAKANAEKNLQNALALFESYLQSVFTQRGPGWVEKRLEDIADADCSLSYGIVQPGEEFDEGMPIVRPTDLTSKVIRLSGLKRIDPKLAGGYKRTALQGGELLLCVRGSTGVVSIASPELVGANVTRGIVPIRFNRSLLLPEFGFYLISGGPVQSQIREKTYGTALMQINIRDLRLISLSIPPLKEQKAIAAKLDDLHEETQRLARIYERKLAALEALKKSLLHQAFTGEL